MYAVYDKKFGDGLHDFIYCAINGPDGRVWLNNNLGAEYARVGSSVFNPEKTFTGTPADFGDVYANGSLFEWERDSDGHELIQIDGYGNISFRFPNLHKYDTMAGTEINPNVPIETPCPTGFRIPTWNEWISLSNLYKDSPTIWNNNPVKMVPVKVRDKSSSALVLITEPPVTAVVEPLYTITWVRAQHALSSPLFTHIQNHRNRDQFGYGLYLDGSYVDHRYAAPIKCIKTE